MKSIWRFLRCRTVRVAPEPSGSRGVDELRPHGRDQLHPAAATIDYAPLPLVQERDTGRWGEPAVRSKSALRKARRDQEAVEESKSSGGETGSDSSPSHLSPGCHQPSDIVIAEVFQRITVQLLSVREHTSRLQETNQSLCRQLSRAEKEGIRLQKEVEELRKALSEKTSALDVTQRELHQVRRQAKEQHAVLLETDQGRKDAIEKTEELQEELAELRTENLFLRRQLGEVQETAEGQMHLSDERFQQQEEKMERLRQELRCVQNSWSSAEKELRYKRRKNIDLQKQNLLLDRECTKVKAELTQTLAQLSDATEMCSSLSVQLERRQQEVRELEQELLQCSQADKPQSRLQERLTEGKAKVSKAQRKSEILKLQQKLKDSQHQLLLAEARVSDEKLLEEELKWAQENEACAQQELHKERLNRKFLEQQVEELQQQVEELQQQVRHSRKMETSLAKTHVELPAGSLHVLEDGKKTDRASSPSQEPPGSLSTLQATQDTKPEGEAKSQDSSLSLSRSQASEIGFLNVASPGEITASQLQKERQSISSEDF